MKRIQKDPSHPRARRRKPEITPEDHALWVHVTKSAKPMPGRKPLEAPEVIHAPDGASSPFSGSLPRSIAVEPKLRPLPPLSGIEKRMVRDISRGSRAIDARIDLHGMRQSEAHSALISFVHRAHVGGAKLALVITGKGGGLDAFGEERGVLRRLVPHWLADPVLRRMVIGFEPAGRGHGGEGALYVRIRRRREG